MPTHKLIHIGALSLLSLALQQAQAACNITPTAGNDTYVCDSGSAGALNDASGNNSLTLPAGGTGTIASVTFGPGTDRVRIDSGTITGAVQQGSGIDDFIMNGGQIQSLAQGDGLDTFLMTGGVIEKEFVDGDIAKMTGGTIGRVDMKLDDNTFDMSGGKIAGNLVTGFGTDTIIVSGSSIIGGNISVSGGNDSITVTGGEIRGQIRASEGDDTFVWKDGGTIKSAILMGNGNDTSLIGNLTESQLSATPSVDGGLDNDQLTFDNSISASPGRYIGWESVNLNNNSRFDLAGDFFLGDSGSGTGAFTVDGSSKLAVTQGNIRPYTAGQLATLNNAGIIDMTTGSNTATDSLTVHGSYVGNGGQLWLQTVLADDTAASDKLGVGHQHARRRGAGPPVRGRQAVLHRRTGGGTAGGVAARLVRLHRGLSADHGGRRLPLVPHPEDLLERDERDAAPHVRLGGHRRHPGLHPLPAGGHLQRGALRCRAGAGPAPVRREGQGEHVAGAVRLG